LEAVDTPKGLEEGVLKGVAGILLGAQHAPRHGQQTACVPAHEECKGRLVASSQLRE
jgi:hypothetical protein